MTNDRLSHARWYKSSYSNDQGGQCVEVARLTDARWFTSSYSNDHGGQCVEAAKLPNAIAVRDSKNPEGPAFIFEGGAWMGFVSSVKAGQLSG
ncbi:DUF397 domain-containing protein [Streptomyces sp. NPDC004726]